MPVETSRDGDSTSPEPRPTRVLGGAHTEFWDYCAQKELRLQKCADCATYMWPPALCCDNCLSMDLPWSLVSGQGTVYSYCIFERSYYPECPSPWTVILVELAEGPLFVSNPADMPVGDLRPGLPVSVTFIDCIDEAGTFSLPVFKPAN